MKITRLQQQVLQTIESTPLTHVIGVDEVGIGAWAGPVVVAGAVFEKGWVDPRVKDSKLMTHQQRVRAWNDVISKEAACYCILSMPPEHIDQLGIGVARQHLVVGVVLYCRRRFPNSLVVMDGELVPVPGEQNLISMPKADLLVPHVSAASVIAKVCRDVHMHGVAKAYPGYGFETNVGYHSAKHVEGLEKQGPCPLHRRSYRPLRRYC